MEWTLTVFATLVLAGGVSTDISLSSTKTLVEETTPFAETTVLNNESTPITKDSSVPIKTTTPLPHNDSKPLTTIEPHDDSPTMEEVGITSTKSTTTITSTLAPLTTTSTITSTTSIEQHHRKKELEEDFTQSVPSVNYYSSPRPMDTINHQFVDVPVSKDIEDVTQIEAPSSSKSSLFAGLIFGSLISLTLGFLIYKRLDSARRRREYRRMNDYLIDGMYNDI